MLRSSCVASAGNGVPVMSYRGRAKVAERVCKHTRTHPDSLRVLFAAAHTNPTARRRTQVLRERQRVRNRSELRFYGCYLTTWPAPNLATANT